MDIPLKKKNADDGTEIRTGDGRDRIGHIGQRHRGMAVIFDSGVSPIDPRAVA
jgi:hypothetical protein